MMRQRNADLSGCLAGGLLAVVRQTLRVFVLWVLPLAFILSVLLTRGAVSTWQTRGQVTRTQVVWGTAVSWCLLTALFAWGLLLMGALDPAQMLICAVAGLIWGFVVGLRVALNFFPQQRFVVESRPADLFGIPDDALRTGASHAAPRAAPHNWREDGVTLGEEVPWVTR